MDSQSWRGYGRLYNDRGTTSLCIFPFFFWSTTSVWKSCSSVKWELVKGLDTGGCCRIGIFKCQSLTSYGTRKHGYRQHIQDPKWYLLNKHWKLIHPTVMQDESEWNRITLQICGEDKLYWLWRQAFCWICRRLIQSGCLWSATKEKS